MEKLLANSEMEGDGGHETTYLAGSVPEMNSGLVTISREIRDLEKQKLKKPFMHLEKH